jgi:hypothetical protein
MWWQIKRYFVLCALAIYHDFCHDQILVLQTEILSHTGKDVHSLCCRPGPPSPSASTQICKEPEKGFRRQTAPSMAAAAAGSARRALGALRSGSPPTLSGALSRQSVARSPELSAASLPRASRRRLGISRYPGARRSLERHFVLGWLKFVVFVVSPGCRWRRSAACRAR